MPASRLVLCTLAHTCGLRELQVWKLRPQADQHTDTITSAHVQSANAHTERTGLSREGSNLCLGKHSPIPPLLMMVVVETGLSAPLLRLPLSHSPGQWSD